MDRRKQTHFMCSENTNCNEHPFFHPTDSRRGLCAVVCSSTGRQCRNCSKYSVPFAHLLIPIKGECDGIFCRLCTIH